VAQKIYVRRDEEKQNKKQRLYYPLLSRFNKGRQNQHPAGPHLTGPPALGFKKLENHRIEPKRGENKCFKCGKLRHFKTEYPEWEKQHREAILLMTFVEE
jgi:hypothetical protein